MNTVSRKVRTKEKINRKHFLNRRTARRGRHVFVMQEKQKKQFENPREEIRIAGKKKRDKTHRTKREAKKLRLNLLKQGGGTEKDRTDGKPIKRKRGPPKYWTKTTYRGPESF